MWPFSSKPEPRNDLEPRLEKVERKLKALDDEWNDVYTKYSRLYARLAKRAKKEMQDAEDALESTNGTPQGVKPTGNPLAARILSGYGVKR